MSEDLANLLSAVFASAPNIEIIVQQRVDTSISGVAAATEAGLYVEYVLGGLKSLLRDGVTPARLLMGLNGRLVASRNSVQEFWYKWEDEKLVTNARASVPALGKRERQILLSGTTKLQKVAVYEWVQDAQGKIFFLDVKLMPSAFLKNKRSIVNGIDSGILHTLNIPIQGKVIDGAQPQLRGVFLLARPLHEFVDLVISKATGVVCRLGGLLSHLIVYASKANIPCVISPVHYERLKKTEHCDLLVANV